MVLSPKRFPTSWAETFEFFSKKVVLTLPRSKKEKVYSIAERVFNLPLQPFDGTYNVLNILKERGYKLHLLTAGDETVQNKRINDAGLKQYFDGITIVPIKNSNVLIDVLKTNGHEPNDCVMIGNSLKSDIQPALKVGMDTIHLDKTTWDYDNQEINDNDKKYIKIHSITDVLNALKIKNER